MVNGANLIGSALPGQCKTRGLGWLRGDGCLACLVRRYRGQCTKLGSWRLKVCCSSRRDLLVLPLVSPSLPSSVRWHCRETVKRSVGGDGRGTD